MFGHSCLGWIQNAASKQKMSSSQRPLVAGCSITNTKPPKSDFNCKNREDFSLLFKRCFTNSLNSFHQRFHRAQRFEITVVLEFPSVLTGIYPPCCRAASDASEDGRSWLVCCCSSAGNIYIRSSSRYLFRIHIRAHRGVSDARQHLPFASWQPQRRFRWPSADRWGGGGGGGGSEPGRHQHVFSTAVISYHDSKQR